MSEPATTPQGTTITLATGDTFATSGEWTRALAAWQEAVDRDASLRPGVEQRLTWLLNENGQSAAHRQPGTWSLVLISGAAALIATVFALIPDEPGSSASNIWAAAAWFLIAVSAVTAIIAARQPRRDPFGHLIQRARHVVAQLEQTQGNGRPA